MKVEDAGFYVITASNDEGTSQTNFEIDVLYPPRYSYLMTSSHMIVIYNCNDSGLYYKCVTIIIYDRNDSGQYYKYVMILIYDRNDSGLLL